jgi:hypothetical protein
MTETMTVQEAKRQQASHYPQEEGYEEEEFEKQEYGEIKHLLAIQDKIDHYLGHTEWQFDDNSGNRGLKSLITLTQLQELDVKLDFAALVKEGRVDFACWYGFPTMKTMEISYENIQDKKGCQRYAFASEFLTKNKTRQKWLFVGQLVHAYYDLDEAQDAAKKLLHFLA